MYSVSSKNFRNRLEKMNYGWSPFNFLGSKYPTKLLYSSEKKLLKWKPNVSVPEEFWPSIISGVIFPFQFLYMPLKWENYF